MTALAILDQVPPGFLDTSARDLHRILSGPTLIHLPGRQPEPLFVSLLLHGNEDVGLRAVQRLLNGGRELSRALSLFVGNVAAARENRRRLEGQADYNRVWTGEGDLPEHALMRSVIAEMRARRPFASVDLHNNTGHNPYYGCVTELRHPDLHLASIFGRTVVFFRLPKGVQTMAFSAFCPAVTLECGRVGDEGGVARAAEFLDACLRLSEIPSHPVPAGDVHLFHTVAALKVAPEATLRFDGAPSDLRFRADLDWFNFRELAPGTVFGHGRLEGCLRVEDDLGRDVTATYLEEAGGELRLRRTVMPSMLTLDERVIRQDCLGYFMERLALP
jgi:hypothetical protein